MKNSCFRVLNRLKEPTPNMEDVLLPSEEQLQAAVKTNSLKSEESKVVLTILQQGYEKFNMPFPTLKNSILSNLYESRTTAK